MPGVRDINFSLLVGYDSKSDQAFSALEKRGDEAAAALREKFKIRAEIIGPDIPGGVAVESKGAAQSVESKSRQRPQPSGGSRKAEIDRELEHELRQKVRIAEAAEKARQREEAAAQKAADKQARESQKAADAAERAAQRKAEAEQRAADKATQAAQRAADQQVKEFMRAAEAAQREADKRLAADQKAFDKAAQSAQKQSEAYQRELSKQEEAFERTREKELAGLEKAVQAAEEAAKKQTAAVAKAYQEHESAVARGKAAEAALLGAFNQTTEGVLKLGRGFVMLGLVGEEDTKKVVAGLLKVQGAIDIVKGGLNLWQGLSSIVDKYRASVEAAEKAQKALAAAQALSKAAGLSGNGAAPRASQASSAVAGAGSGPGGMLAGLLGKLSGVIGPIIAALGALAAPIMVLVGGVTALAGLLFAAGGGFEKIQPGLTKIKDAFERLWEKIKPIAEVTADVLAGAFNALAEGAAFLVDNWQLLLGPIGWVYTAFVGLNKSTDSAAQAERKAADAALKNAESRKALDERLAKSLQVEAENEKRMADARAAQGEFNESLANKTDEAARRRQDLGIGGKATDFNESKVAGADIADRRTQAIEDLKRSEEQLADAQKTGLSSVEAALAKRDAAAQRLIDLEKQHLKVTEDRGKRAIDDLVKQRDEQQKLFEDAKKEAQDAADKLRDAQSKFADLDPFEQERAREAKRKLDKGEQLDSAEAKTLRDLGLDDLSDKVQENRAAEGDVEAGTLFDEEKKSVAEKEAKAKEAEKVLVETNNKLELQITENEQLEKQIIDALAPLIRQMDRNAQQAVEAAVRKAAQEAGEAEKARSAGRKK